MDLFKKGRGVGRSQVDAKKPESGANKQNSLEAAKPRSRKPRSRKAQKLESREAAKRSQEAEKPRSGKAKRPRTKKCEKTKMNTFPSWTNPSLYLRLQFDSK